eukprot:3229295-Amphidinium_carterae.1
MAGKYLQFPLPLPYRTNLAVGPVAALASRVRCWNQGGLVAEVVPLPVACESFIHSICLGIGKESSTEKFAQNRKSPNDYKRLS